MHAMGNLRASVLVSDSVSRKKPVNQLVLSAWAAVGVALVANIVLAIAAFRNASSARRGTNLQQQELEALKSQVGIMRDQVAAAKVAAHPRLHAVAAYTQESRVTGKLTHYHGTEAALEVEVWIRTHSQSGAGWGLYVDRQAVIAPNSALPFNALPASATEQANIPFKGILEEPEPTQLQALVAVSWRRLDGEPDRAGPELQKVIRGEPPGVSG